MELDRFMMADTLSEIARKVSRLAKGHTVDWELARQDLKNIADILNAEARSLRETEEE